MMPFVDLQALHAPLQDELAEAMRRVVASGQLVLGPEVAAFERALAERVGVRHVIGVSSGTDALLAILMALDIGPGDEVITTPLSFFATASVIARLGARPVFADVDPETFNLSPEATARAITPRTRAIMPVHLFGQTADMRALGELADAHGLALVEDAAQAIDARAPDGRQAGALGLAAGMSFFPTKNLGALGDAGAILTDDDALADTARVIRQQGSHPKYIHARLGGNFRMDTLQAAALRIKLPHLARWTARRRQLAALYDDALQPHPHLRPPTVSEGHHHVYHQHVVTIEEPLDRDQLADRLRARGVPTQIYYPRPLHRQEALAHHAHAPCPVADQLCATLLALPIHPMLTDAQQQNIICALLEEASRP